MRAPDAVEPVVAWRNWVLWGENEELSIGSVPRRNYMWRKGLAEPARCPRGEGAPQEGCGCGYYGLQTASWVRWMRWWMRTRRRPPFAAMGEVSMWGKVIVAERGWRSEFAYPKELFLAADADWSRAVTSLERYIEDLEAYGVAVRVLPMTEILEIAEST